jgi:hypothetical protein
MMADKTGSFTRGCAGVGATLVILATGILVSAPAEAGSPPDETGKKYSDASAAFTQAGFKPVVSTTVGDKVPWPDCLVANAQQRTVSPPPNSSGSATQEVLVSLNCYSTGASAKRPGYSAASPQGKAIASANAAASGG